jgi:hypothetical protein
MRLPLDIFDQLSWGLYTDSREQAVFTTDYACIILRDINGGNSTSAASIDAAALKYWNSNKPQHRNVIFLTETMFYMNRIFYRSQHCDFELKVRRPLEELRSFMTSLVVLCEKVDQLSGSRMDQIRRAESLFVGFDVISITIR